MRMQVNALLVEPAMLGALGEMRRKLQGVYAEAEGLRNGLRTLCDEHSTTARVTGVEQWFPEVQSSVDLKMRLALQPPTTEEGAKLTAVREARLAAREAARERAQEDRHVETQQHALVLQLRLLLAQWRGARRTAKRQGMLLRELSAQRNAELEAAAAQMESLRRVRLEHHELVIERETWRKQSVEQADVIAAAISAAARRHEEHEDEVAVLSEKLRQVLEENAGLSALSESQASDLQLLSQEMVRMLPSPIPHAAQSAATF